jgi:hypothetical protein
MPTIITPITMMPANKSHGISFRSRGVIAVIQKGELLGQTSVLKQGLRKPEYGDRSDQIKGRSTSYDGRRAPPVTTFSC